MRLIPAGLVLATAFFLTPSNALRAEESAQQLAEQDGDAIQGGQDKEESAYELATQDGDTTGSTSDESAGQLATQDALSGGGSDDESAGQLAGGERLEGTPGKDKEESAARLAEKEKLEKKPKVIVSDPSNSTFSPGEGVDGTVYAVAAQADGKVVIGGSFNNVDGQPRSNIARIDKSGSVDMTFLSNEEKGVDGTVYAVAVDAKGNVLVGGDFSHPTNSELKNFLRYTSSGKVDPSFSSSQCPNGTVYAIAVQPDGSVVIGGDFDEVGESPRRNLARFQPNGSLAGPVNIPEGVSGTVRALVTHPQGPVFAGGMFQTGPDGSKNVVRVPAN